MIIEKLQGRKIYGSLKELAELQRKRRYEDVPEGSKNSGKKETLRLFSKNRKEN